jgi:hypothetical protein
MGKLLIVMLLLLICATLEVPEDYQWSLDGEQVAAVKTNDGRGRLCSSLPQDINLPESSFSF